jgi:hypothetical protein
MPDSDIRVHEVTFCSRVSKWADSLFADRPDLPFRRTEIEESKGIKRKRSDIRVYGPKNKLILAGEVKLPGTPEGRNPYSSDLVEDSYQKASNSGAEFFFTWNVNKLVLFDAKQWQKPIMERRVKDYDLGLDLENPEDVSRAEVEKRVQEFLAEFFADLGSIAAGKQPDWGMAPDEFFIRAFESHISWPVKLTAEFLWAKSSSEKQFDALLQEWMASDQGWAVVRNDPRSWRTLVDRAARTLCYVFANRLLFYESVRRKFDELKELHVPKKLTTAQDVYIHFQKAFQAAVEATGDYEPLFYPAEKDWAGPHIFAHQHSPDAWRSVLENLRPFNFKEIRTDILGGIFKRLIEPEERHKFGQHYTNEDLVDVINAFCIRKAEDYVLDPACGSGSFLVRAYHRKAWLDRDRRLTHPGTSHQDRLAQIYGDDISLFAAHLSTLNLAAREINDEENYPRIARRNFFEVRAGKPFCELPQGLRGERKKSPIFLPPINAVIGNPPYVRQELIPRRDDKPKPKHMQAKEDLFDLCQELWPGLQLSGRSDLHCYFWPAAAAHLLEGGWFGFLVSSGWLDVEYGFTVQEWVLCNFRINAILESNAEPWFEDARVKTCAVILQRCSDPAKRDASLVKFVRLDSPLADILGQRADETGRQQAAEKFRDDILACKKNAQRTGYRIVVKKQRDLWEEGLRAGRLFKLQKQRDLADGVASSNAPDSSEEGADGGTDYDEHGNGLLHDAGGMGYGPAYGGGKWGKYLRAPNLYFRMMERYGQRFALLGEIAKIRFGVKSGCDAFFMPEDVSDSILQDYSMLDWNNAPLHEHCKRAEVQSGQVRLVKAGDGTIHPVEAEYLKPELHSMMSIQRPLVAPKEVTSIVLMVGQPKDALKGTHVLKYLRYGETHPVTTNKKANALTVSKRATCANRPTWYNLTYTSPGQLIWAKGQQYRHVVVFNKHRLTGNCRLYDVTLVEGPEKAEVLAAIANSTLTAYFKTFYGRYTGTEGSFEMMVIDLNLLELPDPRHTTSRVAAKLLSAFASLSTRNTQPMVEEEFMECRSFERIKKLAEKPLELPQELKMPDRRALDLAVFELLGVTSAAEREALCEELYRETANHFRQIRIVEVQKQEQRAKTEGREFRTDELAADLWDSLPDEDKQPIAQWVADKASGGAPVTIPDGDPSLPDATDFLDPNTVFFRQPQAGRGAAHPLHLPTRAHAEIVFLLSVHSVRGSLPLPASENGAQALHRDLTKRLDTISATAKELAASRTSDEKKAHDISRILQFWMVHGKPTKMPKQQALPDPAA